MSVIRSFAGALPPQLVPLPQVAFPVAFPDQVKFVACAEDAARSAAARHAKICQGKKADGDVFIRGLCGEVRDGESFMAGELSYFTTQQKKPVGRVHMIVDGRFRGKMAHCSKKYLPRNLFVNGKTTAKTRGKRIESQ